MAILKAARLLAAFVAVCTNSVALTIHVSPNGDDHQPELATLSSSGASPFRTIERAQAEIRAIKLASGLPLEGVRVLVAPGTYRLSKPLHFEAEDSGGFGKPIVFEGAEGGEVILSGSLPIESAPIDESDSQFQNLSSAARLHVRVSNVSHLQRFLGNLSPRGHSTPKKVALAAVFFDKKPLVLARWPNEGYLLTGELADGGKAFISRDVAAKPWRRDGNIWLHGYLYWDWADEWVRVSQIRESHVFWDHTLRYGVRSGRRFYFSNVLAELDRPGEWYLDSAAAKIYFWPPSGIGALELSIQDKLVEVQGSKFLSFRRMTFEMCRGTALQISDSTDIDLSDLVIRNIGTSAVRIVGSKRSGISDSKLYDLGESGIVLSGGERAQLIAGELYARHNEIFRYAVDIKTMRPAVSLTGVGNLAKGNLIHDGPNLGIYIDGNDQVVEGNEIWRVATDSDDVGAIYLGRDWASRGNRISGNYLHDLQADKAGAMGVYLDDQASGTTIEYNVFANVQRPIFIAGGRDNRVIGNTFMGHTAAVRLDDRGAGYQSNYWKNQDGPIRKRLNEVPWQSPLWARRYPELKGVLDNAPGQPLGNILQDNIVIGGDLLDAPPRLNHLMQQDGNLVLTNDAARFVSEAYQQCGVSSLKACGNALLQVRRRKLPFLAATAEGLCKGKDPRLLSRICTTGIIEEKSSPQTH